VSPTRRLFPHLYANGTLYPPDPCRILSFVSQPWPRWELEVNAENYLRYELIADEETSAVGLRWRWFGQAVGYRLKVRLLMAGRDYHSTHHENSVFNFQPENRGNAWCWRPYPGVPSITVLSNATYEHAPDWYRNFELVTEKERGLDFREDLATPGVFTWELAKQSFPVMWLTATPPYQGPDPFAANEVAADNAVSRVHDLFDREVTRRAGLRIEVSGRQYLARGDRGVSVLAGFPWFADWGRDTFISMRGLCLATGRLAEAAELLGNWSAHVSEGMLPNRFEEAGQTADFNSVDASLWFIIVVSEFLDRVDLAHSGAAPAKLRESLWSAVEAILEGYTRGTRYHIKADGDGLLAAGEPGIQLTWMDAKVGDNVITPRIGKPVEIQALWINALHIGSRRNNRWTALADQATKSFANHFWNQDTGCLYDVVDCDHIPGRNDPSIRPNQIFALGGLPQPIFTGAAAESVLRVVTERLLTPVGLRSLAPDDPRYCPRYEGNPFDRDSAYHQGTVWSYLLGAYVQAWLQINGDTAGNRATARRRFVDPLYQALDLSGLDHLAEVYDGAAPHRPRGCPFQAWSTGEFLRLVLEVTKTP
jgi:predicted glycogen debranching enzyme